MFTGTKRFGELKKSLAGISHKVLTANLKDMEAAGLLTERYEVDEATALRDAQAWAGKLAECGVLE